MVKLLSLHTSVEKSHKLGTKIPFIKILSTLVWKNKAINFNIKRQIVLFRYLLSRIFLKQCLFFAVIMLRVLPVEVLLTLCFTKLQKLISEYYYHE